MHHRQIYGLVFYSQPALFLTMETSAALPSFAICQTSSAAAMRLPIYYIWIGMYSANCCLDVGILANEIIRRLLSYALPHNCRIYVDGAANERLFPDYSSYTCVTHNQRSHTHPLDCLDCLHTSVGSIIQISGACNFNVCIGAAAYVDKRSKK